MKITEMPGMNFLPFTVVDVFEMMASNPSTIFNILPKGLNNMLQKLVDILSNSLSNMVQKLLLRVL